MALSFWESDFDFISLLHISSLDVPVHTRKIKIKIALGIEGDAKPGRAIPIYHITSQSRPIKERPLSLLLSILLRPISFSQWDGKTSPPPPSLSFSSSRWFQEKK